MQVLVNCDDGISCDSELLRRVEGVLTGTLERFGDRLLRVEAHLSDLGALKPGLRDKICRLEARISGLAPVLVSHQADTLAEAIHDAADQLQRVLSRALREVPAEPVLGRVPSGSK